MELLTNYNKAKQDLFDYFGYKEDWVAIPLDDATKYFWKLKPISLFDLKQYNLNDENEKNYLQGCEFSEGVAFFEDKEVLEEDDGNNYFNPIYTQRFLPKWIYRGKDYTMICVDTRTDGNKFLQIFDNSKELK